MEANYSISPVKAASLLLVAILITIMGGVFIGVITAVVGSIIYIVLITPAIIGVVGGYIVKLGVRIAKIRDIGRVVLLAALVAVAIYGTYNFGRYLTFRTQALAELSPKLENISGARKMEAVDLIIDLGLEKATGHTGFIGYMLYKAQRGVSIGRFYSDNSSNLGPIVTWVYWMLEFGIIFWVTMAMGKTQSQVPVCASCGSWYGNEEHMGGTTVLNEPLLLDLIHRREFVELGKLLERNAAIPSTELYIKRCKRCGRGESFIVVQRALRGQTGKLQMMNVTNLTLQPNESSLLLKNVTVD